ncbi:MAG: M3 family metallopeptidase [Akkermansiaceae bacterium]|jgi:oligopeptidase A
MHPFLSTDFLPKWSTFTAEAIEPSIRHALTEAQQNIETIASQDPAKATYESSFLALEKATESLSRGWGRLQHLDSVSDNPAQREAINILLPDVTDFYSSLSLNPRLFNVLNAVAESDAVNFLTEVQQRHIKETIADFNESGAALPEEEKTRITVIDSKLSKLTKKYSENVLDATNAWELIITDESKLDGLPDSAKAAAAANARSKNIATPAWRITLQAPSMSPIMQHAHDEELRKTVWEASTKVGSEAPYDNSELVWKILELRKQKAEILGHTNFADLTLQRRMARNGDTALKFVESIHAKIRDAFLADSKQLSEYKAAKTSTAPEQLEPWEISYWAERQRKEFYDIDDEDLRPYFPVSGVMEGMFGIATKIFGITITQGDTVDLDSIKNQKSTIINRQSRPQVDTWHPEVTFYEIHDSKTQKHLGSFYADWHPRETKRGGAWMNSLHTGELDEPHLGLIIGNMSPPVDDTPALLTHREVETIFHEFGHLLHGLLSNVPVKSLSGTNVAWDFVELPSQIMENFCWERESLDLFARHYQTGGPIPEALFQKMLAAKNYMSATVFMRQLALGKLDLELHYHPEKYLGRDLQEVDREILADYRASFTTQAPSMALRFNHLFSSPTGYAAGYYSYKWAEVLDADAFSRFKKEGILNPATGMAFRENILSKGNSAPPEVLYENFMSRPADPEALLVRAGLV